MINKTLKINMTTVGLILMCTYIFMSFNALDIIIPSKWNTLVLYAFLAWGVFTTLLTLKQGYLTQYTLWYLVFMLISLIIMLYSPEISLLTGEYYLMIVAFFLTYMIQLLVKDEKSFYVLSWAYAISALVLVATLYFTGNLIASASNRLGGDIMGNANTFADMIMVAVLYELWLIVYGKSKTVPKVVLILMTVINMYALILSAGRKFFVVPFIFLYVLLLFKTDKKGRSHIIKYTIFIAVLVWLAYYLIMNVPVFYENIGYRIESYINGLLGISAQGASAVIRAKMRSLALQKWLGSPIWGYGFDSFKYYAQEALGYFFYSHCNYTELLYNGGIIYFITYYWIYYKIIRNAFIKKIGHLKYRAFAIAVVIGFVAFDFGAVSYSMATTQIMIAMALRGLTFKDETRLIAKMEGD